MKSSCVLLQVRIHERNDNMAASNVEENVGKNNQKIFKLFIFNVTTTTTIIIAGSSEGCWLKTIKLQNDDAAAASVNPGITSQTVLSRGEGAASLLYF